MLKTYEEKLAVINAMVTDLLNNVLNAHKIALSSFKNRAEKEFGSVLKLVATFDEEAKAIDNEVVKTIALYGPEAIHLRELITYIKLTNEFVRIGDYAKTYAKNMATHLKNEVSFVELDIHIIQLHETAIKALEYAMRMLKTNQKDELEELYRKVLVEESKTDEIFKLFEKVLVSNLCNDIDKLSDYLNILATCRKLERTADRATEIAKLFLFAKIGGTLESF